MILLIFAASFALYRSCWDNPFVLDDMTKIEQNPDMQVTSFAFDHFIFPYAPAVTQLRNDPSRPLTYMVYWWCWQLAHGSPLPFHVVNTAVHAGVAALFALWLAEILPALLGLSPPFTLATAALAALAFLSAPIIGGTVVYVYGLSDLLSAFFILLPLFLLARPEPGTRQSRVLLTLVVAACFLLSLASKQSAVVLVPLAFLTDWALEPARARRRLLNTYLPLAVIAGGYVLFRLFYFGAIGDLEGRGSTVKPLAYLLFQGLMILKYAWMTIFPHGFTIDHLYLAQDIGLGPKLLGWATVFLLTVSALLALKYRRPLGLALAVGWLFFLFSLLPTSSFLPTVDMFVERRAYLADIGLFTALASLLAFTATRAWRPARWIFVVLAAAVLAGQSLLTVGRSDVYASTEDLWRESLALDDMNVRARTNLAVYYSASKQYDRALATLDELLQYDPKNGGTYSKIAYIYMQPDYAHYDEAKAWDYLQKSLALLPDNIFALYNGGVILLKHGHFAESEKLLLHATELNPLMANSWLRAGEAALFQGHQDAAIARFRRALAINANQEDAKMYLKKLGVAEKSAE